MPDFHSDIQELPCVCCATIVATFDRTKSAPPVDVTKPIRCAACESKIIKIAHKCGICGVTLGIEEAHADRTAPTKDTRNKARCGLCARADGEGGAE